MNRLGITLVLVGLSGLIVAAMILRDQDTSPLRESAGPAPATPATPATPVPLTALSPDTAPAATDTPPASAVPEIRPVAVAAEPPAGALYRVVKTVDPEEPPRRIGSAAPANPGRFLLEAEISPWGAGVRSLRLAPGHVGSRPTDEPYVLQELQPQWRKLDVAGDVFFRFPLAAESVVVNGQRLRLANQLWKSVPEESGEDRASYTLEISGPGNQPVLRLKRRFVLEPGRFDMRLEQEFRNLTDQPLRLQFSQFSQSEMPVEVGYMGDQRHVLLGYLQPRGSGELTTVPTLEGYRFTHDGVVKLERSQVWPDDTAGGRKLSWVAVDNRYFATAVHAGLESDGQRAARLQPPLAAVRRHLWDEAGSRKGLVLSLESEPFELEARPGAAASWNLTIFGGPKDPNLLRAKDSAYAKLGLSELIYMNLGGMCALCTFGWLTDFLLWFLRTIHDYVTLDWGVAIIILVAVVRLLLHPVTKSSQVNMMKATKQMALLQPEVEKLKKKYEGNDQKFQQEQLKLWREKGINPAVMGLGCLPMFLQMPIWIALYAMLFFAIELRHSPAFWGVFQQLGGWSFLADLSAPDNLYVLPWSIDLWFFELRSINLLPFLLGFVFYFQQKLSPSPPPQNEQAAQQQKIMKFMLLLFPVFLYAAPCGLNLYILASTTVGIIESKRVRKHLDKLEAEGRLFERKPPKPGGFMDRLMKAAEQRMQQEQQTGGKKSRS